MLRGERIVGTALLFLYTKGFYILEILHFEDIEEFVSHVNERFGDLDSLEDDFKDISVIAKYEEARQIVSELICLGYTIYSIDSLKSPDFNEYDDEYLIVLSNIDDDHEISCEPLKRDGNYMYDDSIVTFVLDNCCARVLDYCDAKIVYEVRIGEDNCDELDVSDDDSTYSITIKGNLDMGDAEKILESMERRMMHIQDMFSEMNNFRELFRW